MQRYFGLSQDTAGNIIPSATIRVRLAGTSTDATIYEDNTYTAQDNPFTSESDGAYQFYAQNGRYDIIITKTGYTFDDDDTADIVLDDTMSTITPAQIGSNQNDYSPTNGLNARFWRLSSDAARTITGIAAGNSGQEIIVTNIGSFAITLSNESASSAAANRIITGSGSDLSISTAGVVMLKYDATSSRWRAISIVSGSVVEAATFVMSPGTINGLILSNNATDATNDIDISVGACSSDDAALDDRTSISLTSAITKRLDANWAVGTGQGGLDTGAIANATYHVFAILRTDTNVVDVLFSTSATSPTMPANYDKKRRIGSIVRTGAAIKAFKQRGDLFQWVDPVLDVDAANPGTSAVSRTLTVPTGIKVLARMNVVIDGGGTLSHVYLSDFDMTDSAASLTAAPLAQLTQSVTDDSQGAPVEVTTNTSGAIRSRLSLSDGTTELRIATTGWWDWRGRDT